MLLYGKPVALSIEEKTAEMLKLVKCKMIFPTLCVIRMGENPDDITYERMLLKKGERLGIEVRTASLGADASQFEVESIVRSINFDREIHGILLLRPLNKSIDESKICDLISTDKDVDGVTPYSAAHSFYGIKRGFYPCTAESCMRILDYYDVDLEGKDVVVVSRSSVIGKPVSMLLLDKNATVTICHSKTKNLAEKCAKAYVLITAVGRAGFFDEKYLRENQYVIDVGINSDKNNNLCGDVDMAAAEKVGCHYSPVPGGIGTVTSSLLLWHTVLAAFNTLKK